MLYFINGYNGQSRLVALAYAFAFRKLPRPPDKVKAVNSNEIV